METRIQSCSRKTKLCSGGEEHPTWKLFKLGKAHHLYQLWKTDIAIFHERRKESVVDISPNKCRDHSVDTSKYGKSSHLESCNVNTMNMGKDVEEMSTRRNLASKSSDPFTKVSRSSLKVAQRLYSNWFAL